MPPGELSQRSHSSHRAGGQYFHHPLARRRFSPTLIGYISDRSNLEMGLTAMVVAVAISAAVLFYGMRFAPRISS